MLKFFRKKNRDPKKEIMELFANYELPSFPVAVMNVLTALRDPDISVSEIARKVESDPGLHVKVLKTVNSAAFGLSRHVNNLHRAVALLGRSRLETIVLTQAVNRTLPKADMPFFDMRMFWQSAARRASLARHLAQQLHPATQVEAFTTGLLQDMALPVLVTLKPKEYENIFKRYNDDAGHELDEIELEILGYNHPTIGALIAEEWGLPKFLINAINHHHTSDDSMPVDAAIKLVTHVYGYREDDSLEDLFNACIEHHRLTRELVESIVQQALADSDELSQMLK